MKTQLSIEITSRFFQACTVLIEQGKTSLMQLSKELEVDRANFKKQRDDYSRSIIQLSWLSHLVVKYKVSAVWLLTGNGIMFIRKSML